MDNTVPTASISNDNGLALSCNIPSTTLTAIGGVSYSWSTGATTAAITVTGAGTYTVTVTGANGCQATASAITTMDNTVPTASISSDNGLALSCNIPSTTLTASGGVSYSWSTGATTAAITVTGAGTYTVTVTGANGCQATASAITTMDNTVPTASISNDNGLALSCNIPSTTLTASGGVSYSWSTGATTAAITVTGAGTYTVTVTGANGCQATASAITTMDNTVPTASISSDNGLALSCNIPSTTLTASGGVSYSWSTGATTAAITVTGAGTYTVTVTGANGCQATASAITTMDNTVPTASISSDNGLALSCNIPSTTLTAIGGVSYSWSTGATTAAITVTGAGTYTVTVTGANGCQATASAITTMDNTVPTASISSDNGLALSCSIPSTTLTASGGVSYSWSTGATTAAITVTGAGTYTVTVTGANGCQATASAIITMDNTVPAPPVAGINTYPYDGTPKSAAIIPVNGVTVSWYTASSGGTGSSIAPSWTNAGSYSAWAEARNTASGCVNSTRTLVILDINKIDATINVTPYSVPFDGNAHTATGTATGINGVPLAGLDLSGTTHTAVADYPSDPWIFTDVTGNYNDASGTVHNVITVSNVAPVLAAIGNRSVNEQTTMSFTATATDQDVPAQTLTFSLDAASIATGMSITPTGVFSCTPPENWGGSTYPVTITVTDNGTPILSDFETFNITVGEVNVAPVLGAIGDRSVNAQTALSFTATATDQDLPAQTLVFRLDAASIAAGMSITPGGVFSWTPTAAQGGATYPVTITVTDNGTNPASLSDFETFNITVAVSTGTGSVTVNPSTVQYSDRVTFTARITGGAAFPGGRTGYRVTFRVGTQSMGSVQMTVSGNDLDR